MNLRDEHLDSEIAAELDLRLSFWFEIRSGIQEWQDCESEQSWISNTNSEKSALMKRQLSLVLMIRQFDFE